MATIIEPLLSIWHVLLIAFLLFLISARFLVNFVAPSFKIKRELNFAIEKLGEIKSSINGNLLDLAKIADGAMKSPELKHLWSEYVETLHPQKEVGADGQSKVVRWRSTATAETFFSDSATVYAPLKADFYKHIPGILTGLGIIGTFLGLIAGLSSFDVSDPTKAQSELRNLINAVGHAFFVSGIAIALAMIATWLEKSILTSRCQQASKLRQEIDSLFETGAGEEYLERIVRAAEAQVTQAAQLKDALVADLGEILMSLTQKQLAAHSNSTAQVLQALIDHSGRMSQDFGEAIADHLGGPISDIAQAVKGVSANQGEAVNKMLTEALAAFSAQMQGIFGEQMKGMADLLKETSEAMKQSAENFATLAADMDAAGKGTVEAMGEKLNSALSAMEERQRVMNEQMGEFVFQIQKMVDESQTESSRKLQETLGFLGEQVSDVIAELQKEIELASESSGKREERFEESTGNVIQTLSVKMQELLEQSIATNRSFQESVATLSGATSEAIGRLNQGAETLREAASDFAKAGQGVAETMNSASVATAEINAASEVLSTAVTATKDVLADHARTREFFAAMVAELKSVIENARRDAAMTSEIIGSIEIAAAKLGEALHESGEYLNSVDDVLANTHESFAKHVGDTMRTANASFQKELRTAVDMVSAAVRDLGDTLEDIPGRER